MTVGERPKLYVITRLLGDGIDNRLEYLASQGGVWTPDRIDADVFLRHEVDTTLEHFRIANHSLPDCICTSWMPA